MAPDQVGERLLPAWQQDPELISDALLKPQPLLPGGGHQRAR